MKGAIYDIGYLYNNIHDMYRFFNELYLFWLFPPA